MPIMRIQFLAAPVIIGKQNIVTNPVSARGSFIG